MKCMSGAQLMLLSFVMAFVIGCSDTVTSQYATRAEAEADRLFERGWLPACIPASSRAIITKNDLDLNLSNGEFYFDPGDSGRFQDQLRKIDGTELSPDDTRRFLARRYRSYAFSAQDAEWVFFLNPEKGHCAYRMKLRRK